VTHSIGVTDITALTAAVVGVAALVLSIVNYVGDTPNVKVTLLWDMSITDQPPYDPRKLWGLVIVANVGRRPVYIRIANLKLPKGYKNTHLVLREGLAGQRLAEGDAPAHFVVSQDGLQEYAKDWRKIRAAVSDTAGKEYLSPAPQRKAKPPSWAK